MAGNLQNQNSVFDVNAPASYRPSRIMNAQSAENKGSFKDIP